MTRARAGAAHGPMWPLRALVALSLAIVIACASAPSSALAQDATLRDYTTRVNEAYDTVTKALEAPTITPENADEVSSQVRELLPASESVKQVDDVVRVDNSVLTSLAERLANEETASERRRITEDMAAHLEALVAVAGRPGNAVPSDPAALETLLSDQQIQERNPLSEFFASLVDRLGTWLMSWFDSASVSPQTSSVVRIVSIVLFAALALGLLWMAIRVIVRLRSGIARKGPHPVLANTPAIVAAAEGLPDDALAHADELAASGQWRDAVRALFGGAAREITEAGYVIEAYRRTNGELLLEIRPTAPQVYEPLAALCAEFERSWYGHHDPGPQGFDRSRTLFASVLARLGEAAGVSDDAPQGRTGDAR